MDRLHGALARAGAQTQRAHARKPARPGRYHCKACNVWLAGDKRARAVHEAGAKHREAVDALLLRQRMAAKANAKAAKADADMLAAIDAEARAALARDLGAAAGPGLAVPIALSEPAGEPTACSEGVDAGADTDANADAVASLGAVADDDTTLGSTQWLSVEEGEARVLAGRAWDEARAAEKAETDIAAIEANRDRAAMAGKVTVDSIRAAQASVDQLLAADLPAPAPAAAPVVFKKKKRKRKAAASVMGPPAAAPTPPAAAPTPPPATVLPPSKRPKHE
ncbi:uncharacterized protein AMSG_02609 [Thecamonas trahens ATCC 50062]|uniref:U1-type domain-containing protein n=1 Tax=Thecamonas trahens ATCC 50062 TaxID=461836 RepID=A0A0L0D5H3_THETB|nr:hypothetical protein AMSG_02609 [Thecamonas trahens ATCC 50062]KNC47584.1 hypothetical protein AMSG_02609 [Thecamonas trahens ATCC 50062]|eukprot:XP_013759514.1 hypothetical protein AMSG_02609 [Thecamonas trahens ATCC 50062]